MKRPPQALRVAVLVGAVLMVGGYIVYRTMQAPSADPARPAAAGQEATNPPGTEANSTPGAAQTTHLGGSKSRAVFDPPQPPDSSVDSIHFVGSKSAPTFEPPKPPAASPAQPPAQPSAPPPAQQPAQPPAQPSK